MKKNIIIYLAAAFLAVVSAGCSVNEDGIMGSFPYLEIEITSKPLSKTASSDVVTINSNRSVKATISPPVSWLTANVEGDQLVLTWNDNTEENSREATITLSTPNSIVSKSLKVIQDPSGELTFKDDLILRSKEEIAANTYTKTTSNLIIGNVTSVLSKANSSDIYLDNINAKVYYFAPSDISDDDMNILKEQIHMVAGEQMAVVNTDVRTLPVEIVKSNAIKYVYFEYNDMVSLPSAEVMNSLNLTELSIEGNKVSDISALAGSTTLKALNISGTDVYDLEPIKSMTALQSLSIDDIPVSIAQLEVLREQCKDIYINATELRPEDSPLPMFGDIVVTELSETLVEIKVQVTANDSDISNACFYVGNKRSLDQMERYPGTYSDGYITLIYEAESLDNKIYYVRAYAENQFGGDYSKAGFFGSLTAETDIFIGSEDELKAFYDSTYSHVNGSVLVGKLATSGTSGVRLDDGKFSYWFRSSDFSDLSMLSQLVYVRDGMYIGNAGLKDLNYISHISGMQTLWLKGNKITKIPELDCAETLTYLNVSMNDLTDLDFLKKMPAIETLYLGSAEKPQNETNDIGLITALADYNNLKYVDLSGLPLHQWQVDDLRAAMPNTEIVFVSGGRDPHIPTVKASRTTRDETAVTLKGIVTSKGKSDIIEYGFYYGKDINNLEKLVVGESIAEGETFSCIVEVSDLDIYYWYPYAVNLQGESRNSISEFTLAYEDLSQSGTANCYIIQQPGKYKFNAKVKGNSEESIGTPTSAEVIWEFRNLSYQDNVIEEVNLNDAGYVEFDTAEDVEYGNALIAVKDELGTILWSWHIWMCDFDPEETAHKYKSGNVLMDRHIGATIAVANSYDEKDRAAGTVYQWGRKDPFTSLTMTQSWDCFNTVDEASAQPTLCCLGSNWTYDINSSFWSPDQKTMYDPCPPGWKVADKNSWDDLNAYGQDDYGLMFEYDNNGNTAKYPFGYYYDSNGYYYNSNETYLWTSEYIEGSNEARALYYSYWSWGLVSGRWHTDAYSVRCMRDVGFTVETIDAMPESHTAVVNGKVTYMDATTVSERGFVFSSDNSLPNLNNSTIIASGSGAGNFSATLTDLRPDTVYYVRAYATGEDVTRYGAVVTFKTAVTGNNGDDFTEDDYVWE